MNKSQRGLVHLLLVAIIVSAIGGLVFYSWKGGLLKTLPLQFSSPKPNEIQNEILGWKTYSNEKYGYSFKYPPDWEIWSVDGSIDFPPNSPTPQPEIGTHLLLGYINKNEDRSTSKQMQLYVDTFQNTEQLTLKEYFKKLGWSNNYLDNMKDTKLNNFDAVEMTLPSDTTMHYFVPFDKFIAEFRFSYFETQDKFSTPPTQIFNQILSTFKLYNNKANGVPTYKEDVEGSFCGGIAGITCPKGYTCKLDGNYPDSGGKCVKKKTPFF